MLIRTHFSEAPSYAFSWNADATPFTPYVPSADMHAYSDELFDCGTWPSPAPPPEEPLVPPLGVGTIEYGSGDAFEYEVKKESSVPDDARAEGLLGQVDPGASGAFLAGVAETITASAAEVTSALAAQQDELAAPAEEVTPTPAGVSQELPADELLSSIAVTLGDQQVREAFTDVLLYHDTSAAAQRVVRFDDEILVREFVPGSCLGKLEGDVSVTSGAFSPLGDALMERGFDEMPLPAPLVPKTVDDYEAEYWAKLNAIAVDDPERAFWIERHSWALLDDTVMHEHPEWDDFVAWCDVASVVRRASPCLYNFGVYMSLADSATPPILEPPSSDDEFEEASCGPFWDD